MDIQRLNLLPFAPAYEQQICVLLPAAAHQRINSVLRRSNPTSLTATVSELQTAYRTAYAIVGNYCGSNEAAVTRELFNLLSASLKSLMDAAISALNVQLNAKRGDMERLRNRISNEKGLHDALARGATPHLSEGIGAAVLSTIGAAVNTLNPQTRPGLDIWDNAETCIRGANQALARRDLVGAIAALTKGEGFFRQADATFTAWRDGIELAGRKAQLATGAAAAVATVVAVGVFAVDVVAAGTIIEATTATPATQQINYRIASEVGEGVKRIVLSSTLAEETAGEEIIDHAVGEMKLRLPNIF